jgi:DNA primase
LENVPVPLGNVHLTPQFVQAVRDAVDILAIAGDHTRLRKAGRRWLGLCPLHKEKTPSFSVEPSQNLFYCFGCGQGGDAIKLHQLLTGEEFPVAIENLARRYGVPVPSAAPRRPGEVDPGEALAAAAAFFREQLGASSFARAYLERRRVPGELVERFGIGYAPEGWRGLREALERRLGLETLIAAGLVVRPEEGDRQPYDRFRHRLMFPIHDRHGHLVGFGGRTLGDDRAKYLNSAETDRFRKGHLLYGLHHARKALREGSRPFLVEGYFDVLGAVAAGVDTAVASMGTALTAEQARLLAGSDEVVVGYDGDEAGESAARRALPILLAEGLGVRRARLGPGEDPDSLRLERGDAAVLAAYRDAPDLVLLEIERLAPPEVHREPRLRARAAEAVSELLRPIRDPVLRYSYGRLAADRLGIPAEMLWKRLGVDRQSLLGRGEPAAAPASTGTPMFFEGQDAALRLMLEGDPSLPPPEQLPEPEVFPDPACRNIYRVFRGLYVEGRGTVPEPGAVKNLLADDQAAIDAFARILLQRQDAPSQVGLPERLADLTHRWRRLRGRELQVEIAQAQRVGDATRALELARELEQLRTAVHLEGRTGPLRSA